METDHMGLIMTKEIKVYIRNFLLEELKIREIADITGSKTDVRTIEIFWREISG